jgi:hypothetical protein
MNSFNKVTGNRKHVWSVLIKKKLGMKNNQGIFEETCNKRGLLLFETLPFFPMGSVSIKDVWLCL